MKTEDKARFAQLMTGVAEVYGREMSEAGLSIWWQALDGYDFDQVARAMSAHSKDPERGQFMPKPGDIVRLTDGTATDAAVAAWAKVDYALRRVGGGPSWVFDDPKIHRALDQIGGISALSNCPSEKDLTFLREQFCKRYASTQNTGPYPARLSGWHTTGEPALIGDPERCRQVMAGGGNDRPAITSAAEAATALVEDMRAGGAA